MVQEHLTEGEGLLSVQALRKFYYAPRNTPRPLPLAPAVCSGEVLLHVLVDTGGFRSTLRAVHRSRTRVLSPWDVPAWR